MNRMRILWLKTELLHPVDKGGKIRTYQMLKELKREHQITYLTLDDGTGSADARELAAEYCHEVVCVPHRTRPKFTAGFYGDLAVNLASPLPYFVKKYDSAEMRREVSRRAKEGRFDVLVCDFLVSSIDVPHAVRSPSVLFQHNVEAMIWKRHYQVQGNPLKRAYLYGQWRKTLRYEGAACRRFDRVVAVSREDREIMVRDYKVESVADVPTGVDTDYFAPCHTATRLPNDLVFTGSMDWLPNEDAIRYFVEQIMPRVREAVPGVTLTVVGRNPYPGLVELGKRDPTVTVTGRVDDVRPFMERAALYVVPIRIGGGTRLKIYEAMAMEKPIVSTRIGAEGLSVTNGVDIVLADTPGDFAEQVVGLLKNDGRAREIGLRAAERVRSGFGWDRVAALFAENCEQAVRTAQRRKGPDMVKEGSPAAI
jgi:glycosyltransferase involved in cell wall biosynthesis